MFQFVSIFTEQIWMIVSGTQAYSFNPSNLTLKIQKTTEITSLIAELRKKCNEYFGNRRNVMSAITSSSGQQKWKFFCYKYYLLTM